ncbi:MAG: alpha/beta hydrolase family protein [Anaerolineae bacterium]
MVGPSVEPGPEENTFWVTNPTSGAKLFTRVTTPPDFDPHKRYPALVLVPGGAQSGEAAFHQRPLDQALAAGGFVILLFDPDGRGRSEGQEDDDGFVHQDGLKAVVNFAATLPYVDNDQIGLVSYSFGVTMASGVLARYPDIPIAFYIDWEGPADRNDTGGCDADHTGHLQGKARCGDEAFWRQREAATFIKEIHRLAFFRL